MERQYMRKDIYYLAELFGEVVALDPPDIHAVEQIQHELTFRKTSFAKLLARVVVSFILTKTTARRIGRD